MLPENSGLLLSELADRLGGVLLGDGSVRVMQVAPLATAKAGDISFLTSAKYRQQLEDTQATAVIVPPDFAEQTTLPRIVARNPYACYAQLVGWLNPPDLPAPGVDATARLASSVPASVSIGAQVSVGRDVVLGEGVVLYPGTVLGDGVRIGDHSIIYPNVTIYNGCTLGKRVIIHSGTVIGADGFGFAPEGGRWHKITQIGGVVIGDDVEIGANTTVDRGALDDTVIETGCKLDNQIQVGHNCVIGAHTVIAGCTGIAGSAKIGKGCMIGGAAMIAGHLEIADGCVISPGTMVMKSLNRQGRYTGVYPLDTHDKWMHGAVQVRRIAELEKRLRTLEKQLKQQ